jgi:hypothetical protein
MPPTTALLLALLALLPPPRAAAAPPLAGATPLAAATPLATPHRAAPISPPPGGRPSWRRPVHAAVARPFAYRADEPFRAGGHRGVDFAAAPGTPVRAACAGEVATARPGLVTLRCGAWRVTHLPLASVAVVEGAAVRAGVTLGTVGVSGEHVGLHVGVRRAGDRFAYVDPLAFFRDRTTAPPVVPAPRTSRVPRSGPGRPSASPALVPQPRPAPVPAAPPAAAPASPVTVAPASPRAVVLATPPAAAPASPVTVAPASPRAAAPASPPAAVRDSPRALKTAPLVGPAGEVRVLSSAGGRGLAPWPAWVGLALVLVGAVGGGVRVRARRARARVSAPVASAR